MKTNSAILLLSLALAALATSLLAQDSSERPQPPTRPRFEGGPREGGPREGGLPDGQRPRGPRPGDQGGEGQRPMIPPLVAALDANHDGVIDATEIDNAPAALRKLDKNGDGKLTMEELRPPRPQGGEGQGPGQHPDRPNVRGPRPDGPPGDAPRRPRPDGEQ